MVPEQSVFLTSSPDGSLLSAGSQFGNQGFGTARSSPNLAQGVIHLDSDPVHSLYHSHNYILFLKLPRFLLSFCVAAHVILSRIACHLLCPGKNALHLLFWSVAWSLSCVSYGSSSASKDLCKSLAIVFFNFYLCVSVIALWLLQGVRLQITHLSNLMSSVVPGS